MRIIGLLHFFSTCMSTSLSHHFSMYTYTSPHREIDIFRRKSLAGQTHQGLEPDFKSSVISRNPPQHITHTREGKR